MRFWAIHHRRYHSILLALLALFVLVSAPLGPAVPVQAQGGTTHTVQSGENLFRIALRYNLTVEYLATANNITDPTRVYAGQVLTIPDPNAAVTSPAVSDPALPAIPVPAQPAPVQVAALPAASPVYHTVQAGETLARIAAAYGVTWPDLAAINGITDANTIYSGQQLIIPGTSAPGTSAVALPVDTAATVAVTSAPTASVSGTTTTHIVAAGEHLSSIARAYNLSWPTIARANNITDPNTIYAGQALVIPTIDDGQGGYAQPATMNAPAAAPPTTSTGKQIVVDISDQRVYVYENGALLRNVLISTGVWQYPTVEGDYRVYLKYDSQTMSGPGYYLPGVPWVMYFYKGYSLHGTYWHSNFGTPMSHGCVNMPTPEAAWLYTWAEIGTPVHVQS